ncbi:hypothetical protein PQ462_10930 [Flavobacterium sp. KACC 22758]|uniref:hypothetical protein n=1 Tax=Flavobacterium sp. KACC 22758 TaxID=3025667 RepID=UPI00236687A2|nr:hypothetical protein [Flavobacterium sp. KACC 22758]WDF61880.1 hypothetical protein PQ462_10930 [Flavobacterium sp. KACC 22758]
MKRKITFCFFAFFSILAAGQIYTSSLAVNISNSSGSVVRIGIDTLSGCFFSLI